MKLPILFASILIASPVLALDLAPDAELGKSEAEIRQTLTGMGFDVRKIETEDGKIEAYVVKDGQLAEVYVDPASGKVVKIEDQ
ncbi:MULTISPECIES: PepSY domain-containing protein [unclassified Ruegeria]|uniref:PepSY domain-containing protein n=1 Tax=unclassified Ruegeria TaxID=2625375 RepID=UPI001AE45055|nr:MULTISPECIES: PepSY domain-containing protein [unclassified Ruegeria]